MRIKNALVYTVEHGFVERDVRIKNGCFAGGEAAGTDGEEILDAGGDYLIPGLVDIHFHGCAGHDFSDGTPEALQAIGAYELRQGVTSICPASMTLSEETLKTVCANAYAYTKRLEAEQDTGARLIGIHLEGPFISVNYKGAQDASYIQKPDAAVLKHWNELSGNRIKIVTYAPEEADTEFEEWCLANGIVPSAGHSNATYDQLCGCRACHVTHLYNAQRGLNHREPGVTGYGLLTDGVKAEMICDGIHIKPKMVYMAYKVKGSDGIELITDSMRAKGMPEGKSELGGQTVYVKDGTARLEDGTIAGSVLTYIDAFRNIMKFTDASLKEAVQMSSGNQAKEFGLTQKGEITVGKDADFVILENSQDGNYELKKTISMGEIIEA